MRKYVLLLMLISSFGSVATAAPISHDMLDESNFNTRFDGAAQNDLLSIRSVLVGELNNNSQQDLIFGTPNSDDYGRTNSGSLFILFDYSTVNQMPISETKDLLSLQNYDVKFYGGDGESLPTGTGGSAIAIGDINNDGKNDLAIGAETATYAGRAYCGAVYVILNELLSTLSGDVDISDPNNHSYKIIGAAAVHVLGSSVIIADYNSDNSDDLIVGAGLASYNGRNFSGSIYLIENTIVSTISGPGDVLDLSNADNYSYRFDGALEQHMLGYHRTDVADLDNSGENDLIFSVPLTNYVSSQSGSIYMIPDTTLNGSKIIDLNDDSNYEFRLDGPAAEFQTNIEVGDIQELNNDGHLDLIICAPFAENDGNTFSGSVYVLYNELLNSFTEKVMLLESDTTFNLRFDGAGADYTLGDYYALAKDINNDGSTDLAFSSGEADNNGREDAGAIYVVYHSIFNNHLGTGNVIPLNDESNVSIIYDGATPGDYFSSWGLAINDINGDGKYDYLASSSKTDFHGRDDSGSVYTIINFPHTVTTETATGQTTPGETFIISGNTAAAYSTTEIRGIEFSIDTNSYDASWKDCIPIDGEYDSTYEDFYCEWVFDKPGNHTIYLRAFDENHSYTAQGSYLGVSISVQTEDTETPPTEELQKTGTASQKQITIAIIFLLIIAAGLASLTYIADETTKIKQD